MSLRIENRRFEAKYKWWKFKEPKNLDLESTEPLVIQLKGASKIVVYLTRQTRRK